MWCWYFAEGKNEGMMQRERFCLIHDVPRMLAFLPLALSRVVLPFAMLFTYDTIIPILSFFITNEISTILAGATHPQAPQEIGTFYPFGFTPKRPQTAGSEKNAWKKKCFAFWAQPTIHSILFIFFPSSLLPPFRPFPTLSAFMNRLHDNYFLQSSKVRSNRWPLRNKQSNEEYAKWTACGFTVDKLRQGNKVSAAAPSFPSFFCGINFLQNENNIVAVSYQGCGIVHAPSTHINYGMEGLGLVITT